MKTLSDLFQVNIVFMERKALIIFHFGSGLN